MIGFGSALGAMIAAMVVMAAALIMLARLMNPNVDERERRSAGTPIVPHSRPPIAEARTSRWQLPQPA